MISLKTIGMSIFQIFSLCFVLLYLLGVLNTHFSDKNNYCGMTYMFEYPQFVRISVHENQIYPQYGLYAYGEGRLTEKARKMWFDGIPVLFLPGNSGSHMQARSLASVALRMAISNSREYHFDYFTVSYNEDLSGLYGGVLQSETEFTAACINKILGLYKSNKYTKTVPTSVILIGHSMGGVIAKKLMAYPQSMEQVNIAITLAAPLEAPVINTDLAMDRYYRLMEFEWDVYINSQPHVKDKKLLLSFGNGVRDVLMPSGLTSTNDSDLNALTTAIPGVWVSPDHVSIVWCKQLVLVINRFLFSIISEDTGQVADDKGMLMRRARQYFEANRSMVLSADIPRANVTMIPDAFWYEDNRRVYQIARPEIDKTTYLMIRLVTFPQHRFVAIESVNVDDKDWIFGCNAEYTYGNHRYCKQATSLTELSRWSGAAKDFGKRKLATIHLHDIIERQPSWTHVVVKVSPTRKPILLNVDINDHASRVITADLPSDISLAKQVLKQETEPKSIYYRVLLPGFESLHQAYLLYVEPSGSCRAANYHVTAELHVPWARNHEYTHYFTHLKRSPMKLRLFKSNPNVTLGLDAGQHVEVTLLLDPQCTFTISISTSWYHRLAQLARNYTPVLLPYTAAIVLLAARSNLNLLRQGKCASIHSALMSESVKPYYALVFSRLALTLIAGLPPLAYLLDTASSRNLEMRHLSRSLLVLPAYMAALGALNVAAAALLLAMLFSSQLAHRLLFRIMCRGGPALAERVAQGLRKVPMVASAALLGAVPLACGAASLAAGAAFYAFMISKMYEEYLEDYVYKIMAKLASRACHMFFSKKSEASTPSTELVPTQVSDENIEESHPDTEVKAIADSNEASSSNTNTSQIAVVDNDSKDDKTEETKALIATNAEDNNKPLELTETAEAAACAEEKVKKRKVKTEEDLDEELNNLNFHVMMFFLWMVVTVVNVPALMTWARNFKYSMVLKPDTSYHSGLILSACSAFIWQLDGPRRNLRYYDAVSALLFTMAVFILALGPLSFSIVNYGVTAIFAVITLQQLLDKEDKGPEVVTGPDGHAADSSPSTETSTEGKDEEKNTSESETKESGPSENKETSQSGSENSTENASGDCDVCSESRIYKVFKGLREKFDFTTDEL